MAGLSKEDRDRKNDIKRKYQLTEYEVYSQLYRLADSLDDRHSIRNVFKKYYSRKSSMPTKTIAPSSPETVRSPKGVAITNPQQTRDQIKDTFV